MSTGTRVCTMRALMDLPAVCLFVCLKRQGQEYTATQFRVRVTQFRSPISVCEEGTESLFDTVESCCTANGVCERSCARAIKPKEPDGRATRFAQISSIRRL